MKTIRTAMLAALGLCVVAAAQDSRPSGSQPTSKTASQPTTTSTSTSKPTTQPARFTEREYWAKLQAEVKAGKMSMAAAQEQMDAFERKFRRQARRLTRLAERQRVARAKELATEFRAAVERGTMTQEEADGRIETILKREQARRGPVRVRPDEPWEVELKAELDRSVKAGTLSRREANAKLEAERESRNRKAAEARNEDKPSTASKPTKTTEGKRKPPGKK